MSAAGVTPDDGSSGSEPDGRPDGEEGVTLRVRDGRPGLGDVDPDRLIGLFDQA